jgi:Ca2+-binding RTX toxin-like protein
MATLNVPVPFTTITAAAAAATAGDTIIVGSSYGVSASVEAIATNNLIINAAAGLTGIRLSMGSGVANLTLAGTSDIEVRGNGGANVLTGNMADNVLRGNLGNDTIDGGAGEDWSDYSQASGAVQVTLTNGTGGVTGGFSTGADGNDTLSSIERIRGSSFVDVLTGNDLDNFLRGNAGNDTIDGGAGEDWSDYASASGAVQVTLTDGTGIVTGGFSTGADGNDTLISIERIRGSNFDDTLSGNSANNVLRGNGGNDTIDGGAGRDAASYGNATGAVQVTLTDGTGGVTGGFSAGADGNDTLVRIENIFGSDFADLLTGNSASNILRGNLGNDTINGGAGIDTASYSQAGGAVQVTLTDGTGGLTGGFSAGADGNDTLINIENIEGSSFADVLSGNAANNVFFGNAGNDTINGGAGVDVAVFAASRAQAQLQTNGGVLSVTINNEVDTISNIERLRFSDQTLAFDIEGNAGQAYRMYQAAFARTPDVGGLSFWTNRMDTGTSLIDVARNFVALGEFQSIYGANPSNVDIIGRFYLNVLNRAGEPGGVNFWVGELNSGARTVAQVLAGFSESPENIQLVGAVISNGITLDSTAFL